MNENWDIRIMFVTVIVSTILYSIECDANEEIYNNY